MIWNSWRDALLQDKKIGNEYWIINKHEEHEEEIHQILCVKCAGKLFCKCGPCYGMKCNICGINLCKECGCFPEDPTVEKDETGMGARMTTCGSCNCAFA
eukprot:51273_1